MAAVTTIVGLKRLDTAKQRLDPDLEAGERRLLMLRMLEAVLAAVHDAALGPVAIATSEPSAPALARRLDAVLLSDAGLPWNDGLVHALASLPAVPERVLFLAGDLPLVRAGDLRRFAEASPTPGVGIARARDGGTNALLLTPAGAMRPGFGEPRSSEVHAARARDAGLAHAVVDIAGLALDVDTAADARDAGLLPASAEQVALGGADELGGGPAS